jgi:predicted RNase H-related nuclease YkuK (DUF458 family)
MVGIIDFKKASGKTIPNIVEYVRDYVNTHSNIQVVVTSDSQSDGTKTTFCTAVIMYDKGTGDGGHGAHCIWKKWSVPRYKKEQRQERLLKEVEESIIVGKELRDHGVTVDMIDIDINGNAGEKKKNKSNEVFEAAKGWVEGEGFVCTWKNFGNRFASFPDTVVKK